MPKSRSMPAYMAGHASPAEVPTGTHRRNRHPAPPALAGLRRGAAPPAPAVT
ncbi:hypothetical protein BPS26883_03770 [Burkholderia pseudomultivorans]|uniref:Uncharacterized protein n=1 Tax=Burkholderia pseudomultivorans TaxID=1207504 RepID=A0A6P2M2M4_9BURK|nr:hypothetical protein BPS26883_03770 [Burkholderia pseudomultivorans]